jgi:hypothetical protein
LKFYDSAPEFDRVFSTLKLNNHFFSERQEISIFCTGAWQILAMNVRFAGVKRRKVHEMTQLQQLTDPKNQKQSSHHDVTPNVWQMPINRLRLFLK